MLYVKLPEACPLALQVLPPPALAFLGASPLDVKPEKICNDDECDMYNYLKPVPLLSRYSHLLLQLSWVHHLFMQSLKKSLMMMSKVCTIT